MPSERKHAKTQRSEAVPQKEPTTTLFGWPGYWDGGTILWRGDWVRTNPPPRWDTLRLYSVHNVVRHFPFEIHSNRFCNSKPACRPRRPSGSSRQPCAPLLPRCSSSSVGCSGRARALREPLCSACQRAARGPLHTRQNSEAVPTQAQIRQSKESGKHRQPLGLDSCCGPPIQATTTAMPRQPGSNPSKKITRTIKIRPKTCMLRPSYSYTRSFPHLNKKGRGQNHKPALML